MVKQYEHIIDGRGQSPATGSYFETTSPATGEVLGRVAQGNAADIDNAVRAAHAAQKAWAKRSPLERGQIMMRFGTKLQEHAAYLGQLETDEIGLPSGMAPKVAHDTANYFDYYGGLAASVLGEVVPVNPTVFCYNLYEPYGVIGVILPWNGPLLQAARAVAPALAVGNAVVIKPSEFASLSTIEFARVASEAGVPDGLINVVTGDGKETGEALVRHPLVRKVSFTGSVPTGQAIGAIAAQKIMPLTLELGGKSPNIVFEDADFDAAVAGVLKGFLLHSGQICTSGTRVLVQRSIFDAFSSKLAEGAKAYRIGRDKQFPTLGPVANKPQYDKILGFFESARAEGARCLAGGEPARGEGLENGLYIAPTIYTDVTLDMRVVREEIFGPVAVLIPFDTEEEALTIANGTEYGLAAGVWTRSASRAHRVSAELEAGTVYVNTYHESAIEAPMGGYKQSGMGREKGLASLYGYLQLKNVTMKLI